jgi:three-Cys-motif partner protein
LTVANHSPTLPNDRSVVNREGTLARSGAVPQGYDGREQAHIKHELLKGYMEKLFFIVGGAAKKGGRIELRYVDCFAGPWGDDSGDLKGTSIAISLHTLGVVRARLGRSGVSANIRALYIEKDAKRFDKLQAYLNDNTPSGIHAEAWRGDFVAKRADLLQWTGKDAFTFFFIDPMGWKDVGISTLRPLLERSRSEFLINFMYDFVNRTMSMAEWRSEMAELLGEAVSVDGMTPAQREHAILRTYRSNLKKVCLGATRPQFPPRSAYVRVFDRDKQRPKYHLVYVTTHPLGIVEFMTISEGVDLVQKQVRAELRDAKRERDTGVQDMFGPAVDAEAGHADAADVDRFWLDYLAGGERRVDEKAFADILEDKDWFPGDLQASLVRLIDSGRVRNLNANRRRPTKPLHYKDGDRLQRIGD